MTTRSLPRRTFASALAATAFATLAVLTSALPASASAQEIIIGAPLAMTGPAGQVGVDIVRGAQLAIDEINAAGGVMGRKLRIDVQDTTGAPAQAVQLVGSFARNPNVMAILGPINAAEVGAVTNLAASNKLVVYAPASAGTVPGVPDLKFNDWTFRLNQSQPTVLGPLLNQVAALANAKSITILNYSDNSAYVDAGNLWQKTAEGKGMTVQRIQFPSATQDFSAIVTQIKKDTQLIGIGALPATLGPLIRAIRQAGIQSALMGDASILTASVFTVSQGASKGAYSYSSYLAGAGTGTNEFIAGFKKAHGAEPSAIASYGYEAVKLVANAMTTQKSVSRQAVRDGLGKTSNYAGITGAITYNNSGDAIRQTVPLVQVGDNGELKKVADIPLK